MADPTLYAEDSKIAGWIQVARTGKFPQGDLTRGFFDKLVKNFNTKNHEPPYTVGHITRDHGDKPAMGWGAGIKRIGDFLYTKGKQISNELDGWVRDGRYKKRSIGIRYNSDKEPYLHHVAFLGATVPACKGLANIYQCDNIYSDDDTDTQKSFESEFEDISFSKENSNNPKEHNMDPKTYSEAELKLKENEASAKAKLEADAEAKKNYDEKLKEETKKIEDAATEKAKKEFSEKEDAHKALLQHENTVKNYLDDLQKKNKISPAMRKSGLDSLLFSLGESKEITYSEGEGDKAHDVKTDQYKAMCKILEGLPAQDFGAEIEAPEGAGEDFVDDKSYAGEEKAIKEYMDNEEKAGRISNYGDAMLIVRAQLREKKAEGAKA